MHVFSDFWTDVLLLNVQLPAQKFLIPRPPRTKFNQRSPAPHTCPENKGTRNSRGLTRPAQDSSLYALFQINNN